ncbi:hypothetical protein [Sulfitobacter sp.]|uniref:hypothetical protein n=1 Tax=Sulfitobacter sp. TaxID=1903071 RepID=UPI00356988F2
MPPEPSASFSADEQAALGALVAQIIPASQQFGQPAADDPDILADILTTGAALRDTLATALAWLSGQTVDAGVAAEFRQVFPAQAEVIQTLTVQCYYRDARVMRALNIDVRPPFPTGYTQEPNDFALLDPVRQRGEIYRKLP